MVRPLVVFRQPEDRGPRRWAALEAVAQRTHEIGVRIALGAQRSQVVGLVVREGMRLAAVGITVGLAAVFALTRLMASLLYDVKPTDPSTYAAVAATLAATALAACCKPALQAAWVDPARALLLSEPITPIVC
jgi:putative ABC transport system permease protein